MSVLPNPFLNPVESFPASTGSGAAAAYAPASSAAPAPIPNSVAQPSGATESAVPNRCVEHTGTAVPIDVSVIGHNPVTHEIEVRPIQSSCGSAESRRAECSAPRVHLTDTPCLAEPEVAPGPHDATNHIGEIFHHARKLMAEDARRAEDFINWNELEAALAEPLPLFLREDGYLRRRA